MASKRSTGGSTSSVPAKPATAKESDAAMLLALLALKRTSSSRMLSILTLVLVMVLEVLRWLT